jgi:hypothetical protein
MRLSRQSFSLLFVLAAIACSDTTAPVRVPAYFDLANVSGRSVPAPFMPASSPVATILSAYLFLDANGKAVMSERRREVDGREVTITNIFDYAINGNQIEIGSFSPCGGPTANCVGTYKGTISNDALSLTIQSLSNGDIVYNYRRQAVIPA